MDKFDKGYLITASVSSARKIECDEIWQITRSDKMIKGLIWVPELAPSWTLYNTYIHDWSDKSPEEWWPKYKSQFIEEFKSDEKIRSLRRLWNLINNGKVIAIVCFCADYNYCHRSLIAQFLEEYGIRTEEFGSTSSNQQETITQQVLFEMV